MRLSVHETTKTTSPAAAAAAGCAGGRRCPRDRTRLAVRRRCGAIVDEAERVQAQLRKVGLLELALLVQHLRDGGQSCAPCSSWTLVAAHCVMSGDMPAAPVCIVCMCSGHTFGLLRELFRLLHLAVVQHRHVCLCRLFPLPALTAYKPLPPIGKA